MPIYEYRCQACGHYLDALQKISDSPLVDCPECAEPKLKRLISAPSFRLKGSGWYETDFKSDKERKRNLAEGGASDGGGKESGGSDSGGSESGGKSSGDTASSKSEGKADAKADKKSSDSKSASKEPAAKKKGSGSEAA